MMDDGWVIRSDRMSSSSGQSCFQVYAVSWEAILLGFTYICRCSEAVKVWVVLILMWRDDEGVVLSGGS